MESYMAALTFECVVEILLCDHPHEAPLVVLWTGTICFSFNILQSERSGLREGRITQGVSTHTSKKINVRTDTST